MNSERARRAIFRDGLFWRVKPIDQLIAGAEKKALRRSLGPMQLTLFGVGTVIGTGIFVLTAEAAQKAGPGMMISFTIAAAVCAVAALCYAEIASMVPVAGSAYTYSYAVLGEHIAWLVGWALILEYAVAGSAVAVGWSGYAVGLVENLFQTEFAVQWTRGPEDGGLLNLPAALLTITVTLLLLVGTRESVYVNSVLVIVKLLALAIFIALTIPVLKLENFEPFAPLGFAGISAAAGSIFFAYIGFDAVSTAAEETRNPQRNVPIGLLGSLLVCTIFYLLVAAGVTGTVGAQPLMIEGVAPRPGSIEMTKACFSQPSEILVCSREGLAFTLREIGWPHAANLLGLAVGLALPSVVLLVIYGQSRIFFVMARDGLLPSVFAKIHARWETPHVVTMFTGIIVATFAALLPLGRLADISNAGTLFAFLAVSFAAIVLRVKDPTRHRPFRAPGLWFVAPAAIAGCIYLFWSLGSDTKWMFAGWTVVGIATYAMYGYRKSHLGRGIVEPEVSPAPVPGTQ